MLAGIEEPSLGAVSKKKDLLDWLLRSIRCLQIFRTVWEEMVHLFECGNFEETSAKQLNNLATQTF